jgi:signal transduction histidine kinase
METWEKRAIEEVSASIHQESLALRDSLPEFLGQIALALSTTVNRTDAKVRWDRKESTRVGKKHGKERAGSVNYTMDQLIFEYHILRQVICEVMEDEAPLSSTEREVIVCAVEQAVNDAATQFSETLSSIQEAFTNTLAHDLRGPIAAAKLSVQILMKKPSDAQLSLKVASRVLNSMDRLDFMLHDLLDAGRIRAGQTLRMIMQECDFDFILSEIADEINFTQGSRIIYNSPGKILGIGNEEGLRRIFDNLISNALKFSYPRSPVTVSLKNYSTSIEISVHNLGEAIKEEEEKAILFQQYRRVQTGEGKSGWGLGLAVVKGITEAHGGHVEVESLNEVGTTFKVILPIKSDTVGHQ